MSLSIIIVNYKTPRLLAGCISSIYAQTRDIEFEIIVVDNASNDNSRQLIIAAFPGVKWIQLDYNAGFARANNEGIRRSAGDTVLLLNSDTINENDAIGRCYQVFSGSPYIACGVQLLNADRSPQISGNYFMTGGLNNLLPLPYTGKAVKWLGNIAKVKKPHVAESSAAIEVDWINGAFLMVKKDVIGKAGLLDKDFFLYAEEAEWCYRLGKHGKLVIYGQFNVIHLQGETSNATFKSFGKGYYNLYDTKGLQIMVSNFVRIRKQFGAGWFIFQLLVYTFTVPVYLILGSLQAIINLKNPGPTLSSVWDFSRNVCLLWGYFLPIVRKRPFFYKVI